MKQIVIAINKENVLTYLTFIWQETRIRRVSVFFRMVSVSVASHAGVFRGARFSSLP